MTTDPDEKKPNVVNLAEARRRQRTVRAGASGKGEKKTAPKAGKRVWVYLQFLLFLAALAYLMQLCQHGS